MHNNQLWLNDFAKAFNKLIQTGYGSGQLREIIAPIPTPMPTPRPTPSPTQKPTQSPTILIHHQIKYENITLLPTSIPSESPIAAPTQSAITRYYNKKYEHVTLYPTTAIWTHFIYMMGDNDLDDYGAKHLNRIIQNNNLNNINFVAYFDRSPNHKHEVSHIHDCNANKSIDGNFVGAKLLQKQGNRWCQIIDFDRMNALARNNIADFVSLFEHFQTSSHFFLEFWVCCLIII